MTDETEPDGIPTWLVTGCSTGLGRHLAEAVLERGWNAVVTARDPGKVRDLAVRYPQSCLAMGLDVTDYARARAVVEQAGQRFGGVDVLVNNAGYGYRSAVEEGEDEDVRELFATNFFGPTELIKRVLPGMRERRRGAIVNVSSIAGRRSAAGSGYYAATKFALEGLSDALRKEVGPLGITVLVVEPGALRTDFAGRSLNQSDTVIADYAATAGLRRKEVDTSHGRQLGDPVRAANVVLDVLQTPNPPFRILLGSDAVTVIRKEHEEQGLELERWAPVSAATDFHS